MHRGLSQPGKYAAFFPGGRHHVDNSPNYSSLLHSGRIQAGDLKRGKLTLRLFPRPPWAADNEAIEIADFGFFSSLVRIGRPLPLGKGACR